MTTTSAIRSRTPAEKKRLGQYFTGQPVARLLSALARADHARRILDPMVGSGDMLEACLSLGATPESLQGVDIDPQAIDMAVERLPASAELRTGNAFSAFRALGAFDLVITNPPYVRYQALETEVGDLSVPAPSTVRDDLLKTLQTGTGLPEDVREFLVGLARSYSGLSDLAVPSWILVASLVAPGGTMAVLVPNTWLSRNYAEAVRRLLGAMFTIDFVVEDHDASWFEEALVRTVLIVARRKRSLTPDAIWSPNTGAHMRVVLDSDATTPDGIVGSIGSERDFAAQLQHALALRLPLSAKGVHAEYVPARDQTGTMTHSILPTRLATLLRSDAALTTLADIGWAVGQGLRTGANEFFYADSNGSRGSGAVALPRLYPTMIDPPTGTLLPAIRRQADLPSGYCLSQAQSHSRLLFLDGWATASDASGAPTRGLGVLSDDVQDMIDRAALLEFPAGTGKAIPSLSAVRTNVNVRPGLERFWYQLPALQDRHRPDLLMPRVCGGSPKAYANPQRSLIVDANFTSLWATTTTLPARGLLALLNSDFVIAQLELTANALGGGALKVEAAHLRRILLPVLDENDIAQLTRLGADLCTDERDTAASLNRINSYVAQLIGQDSDSAMAGWHSIRVDTLTARQR